VSDRQADAAVAGDGEATASPGSLVLEMVNISKRFGATPVYNAENPGV